MAVYDFRSPFFEEYFIGRSTVLGQSPTRSTTVLFLAFHTVLIALITSQFSKGILRWSKKQKIRHLLSSAARSAVTAEGSYSTRAF